MRRNGAAPEDADGAPPPPLERERYERALAALGKPRSQEAEEVAGPETLVAEELRAARHIAGLPDPEVKIPGTRTRSKVSDSRRPSPEAGS